MNNGYLSQYFESVAVKTLREVEVNASASNQHEFNGTKELKKVIKTRDPAKFPTKFIWMEEENEAIASDSSVSWYNSRKNQTHRSSEFRLYFQNNEVMRLAKVRDKMFFARRTDNTLLVVITPEGSTIERQLYWLFNLQPPEGNLFSSNEIDNQTDIEIGFSARFILEELGIEIEEPENDHLDRILEDFSGLFPTTSEFSSFARKTLRDSISIEDDPDHALLAFMNWEEKLFRRLERHNVGVRLRKGFVTENDEDVDGFLSYSLSVQNRRKSRAGSALEEHLKFIFNSLNISFSKGQKTENKSKPDFLFPSISLYRDENISTNFLTMLGAKTSLKDRWRQVLSEAAKITPKHLITLEPGISEFQTNEMKSKNIQLVLPKEIHQTFTENQQNWLYTFKDFIQLVRERERELARRNN